MIYYDPLTKHAAPRDADLCTVFDCQPGFYDADWNVQNGCEAPCPVVPNADCLLCQGPYVCKEQRSGRKLGISQRNLGTSILIVQIR